MPRQSLQRMASAKPDLQGVPKMTPCVFCQNFYNQWHFFSQILHIRVLNKDTHVDHFLWLILNYTE